MPSVPVACSSILKIVRGALMALSGHVRVLKLCVVLSVMKLARRDDTVFLLALLKMSVIAESFLCKGRERRKELLSHSSIADGRLDEAVRVPVALHGVIIRRTARI